MIVDLTFYVINWHVRSVMDIGGAMATSSVFINYCQRAGLPAVNLAKNGF